MKRLFFLMLLLLPACGSQKKLEEEIRPLDLVITFDKNITTTIRCEQIVDTEHINVKPIEKIVM